MSPGDPSTLTGRAAPSGSRAEQGRSVFAEPPTVSWLFRQALRSQLESNKTRPFFALSPAPLPCTPVRATCSLGEVTLSAGPQGGRACHPLPPPPLPLPCRIWGAPAAPRSLSPCDLRSPVRGQDGPERHVFTQSASPAAPTHRCAPQAAAGWCHRSRTTGWPSQTKGALWNQNRSLAIIHAACHVQKSFVPTTKTKL